MSDWQPLETIPTDGTTVEVRGTIRVHFMQGSGYAMMPDNWRPDTPHTEWRFTEWREVTEKAGTANATKQTPQTIDNS